MVPRPTVPDKRLTQPFQRVRFGLRADRAIGGGHEARTSKAESNSIRNIREKTTCERHFGCWRQPPSPDSF